MKTQTKALINVLLCVGMWSLIPIVSKLGQSDLDNHQFLFWSSIASLITFIFIIYRENKIQDLAFLSLKKWIYAFFLGLLGTYLYYILLYFGYANAQGLEVLVIQYCWPIFVIILSIFLLNEKLTFIKSISILLGFSGVVLVLSKGNLSEIHLENFTVDGIVLLAAFTAGLFSVLSKRIQVDPTLLVSIYFLSAVIASFISMQILSNWAIPTVSSIIPILVNGILVNGLSYLLWVKALKAIEASKIAPLVFLSPVLSTILLIVLFNEPFQSFYLIGMALVIVGGLLNSKG